MPGKPSRRGEIIELLGLREHEHYRVRWDQRHESIVYLADGVIIIPPEHGGSGAGGGSQRTTNKRPGIPWVP